MEFYNIDMQGKLIMQRDTDLPPTTAPNEGRLFYDTTGEDLYYQTESSWTKVLSEDNVPDLAAYFLRRDQDDSTVYTLGVGGIVINGPTDVEMNFSGSIFQIMPLIDGNISLLMGDDTLRFSTINLAAAGSYSSGAISISGPKVASIFHNIAGGNAFTLIKALEGATEYAQISLSAEETSGVSYVDIDCRGNIYLKTDATLALTIDTSQNATFKGNILIGQSKYITLGTDCNISRNFSTLNISAKTVGMTFSTGVLGTTTALRLDNNQIAYFGAGGYFYIEHFTSTILKNTAGLLNILNNTSNGINITNQNSSGNIQLAVGSPALAALTINSSRNVIFNGLTGNDIYFVSAYPTGGDHAAGTIGVNIGGTIRFIHTHAQDL